MATQEKQIKVDLPKSLQGGVYSNFMAVTHTKEEFFLDFIMITPTGGTVTARVICSPGHMKRIQAAIQDNVQKYERAHGAVRPSDEPQGSIGFTVQ